MISWAVIRAKPRQEAAAALALQRLGYETYYPRHRRYTWPRGRQRACVEVLTPWWPGYLFAADWHGWPCGERFSSAVIGLARFGQQIAMLSDADLQLVREAEAGGAFDEHDPRQRRKVRDDLKPGDPVELEAFGRPIEAHLVGLSANGSAVLRSLDGVRFTARADALRLRIVA